MGIVVNSGRGGAEEYQSGVPITCRVARAAVSCCLGVILGLSASPGAVVAPIVARVTAGAGHAGVVHVGRGESGRIVTVAAFHKQRWYMARRAPYCHARGITVVARHTGLRCPSEDASNVARCAAGAFPCGKMRTSKREGWMTLFVQGAFGSVGKQRYSQKQCPQVTAQSGLPGRKRWCWLTMICSTAGPACWTTRRTVDSLTKPSASGGS